MKFYLTKRTIFRKITTNSFPIHFTSREMNQPLISFRTILHLKKHQIFNHYSQITHTHQSIFQPNITSQIKIQTLIKITHTHQLISQPNVTNHIKN